MLDGSRKLENEWLLPSGSLREPISACRRADLLVVSRKFDRVPIEAEDAHIHRIFYAQTRLLGFRRLGADGELKYVSEIGDGPFLRFAESGTRMRFSLISCFGMLNSQARRDFAIIKRTPMRMSGGWKSEADKASATGFVTTEKDAANLVGRKFRRPVWVAVIDFVFSAETEFVAAIDRVLRERRGGAA